MATVAKRAATKRKGHTKDIFSSRDLLLAGDLIVTALWVLMSSTFSQVSEWLAAYSGLQELGLAIAVTCVAIVAFGPLCDLFGGALFNPVHNVAMIIAGKGTWKMNLLRAAFQLAGAFLGSLAAINFHPPWLTGKLPSLSGGLKSGVALEQGFACEAFLGALLNIVVLFSFETQHKKIGFSAPIAATILLNAVGAHFTGPSLNPAVTFSWYYHYAGHTLMEHVLVFWVAPLVGAVVGGLLWRAFVADSTFLLGTKPLHLPVAKAQAAAAARKQARAPVAKEL